MGKEDYVKAIDVHAHIIPQRFIQMLKGRILKSYVRLVKDEDDKEWLLLEGRLHPLLEEIIDPEKKIKTMNKTQVEMQLLSVPPPLYFYDLPDKDSTEVARMLNDGIMEIVKDHFDRFGGLATLPMQNIESALTELERCLSLGMKGIAIGTSVRGEDFDHPRFIPFFARAAEFQCPIVFHPPHVPIVSRFRPYHLVNLIGNPLDTTIAIARIVFAGILRVFPNLKLCFVHAGGQAPFLMGRFDHGYKVRDECRENIDQLPSEYMKMLYYDSVTHDAKALQYLIEKVGSDHVLIGSDHPYDMAVANPCGGLDSLCLPEKEKNMIYRQNALRLFNWA
jgi:aminocarboxymuconate-semialdehyde decarboxylase